MQKLKLTSVRLDEETLRMIDEYASRYDYYTRSFVINAILAAVMKCSDNDTLWKIVSTYSPNTCGFEISFRVSRDKLENLPRED